VFLATVILGIGVVGAISAAPLYARRVPVRRSGGLGAALVLAAVGLSLAAAAGTVPLAAELALGAFPLLLCGALLLLAADGGRGGGSGGPDGGGEPPWWPEFEDAFRAYSGRRVPVGSR
jgi:hypothetical protein